MAKPDPACACGHVMSRHFNYGACTEVTPARMPCECQRFETRSPDGDNPMHFAVYALNEIADAIDTGESTLKWYPQRFYDADCVDEVMTLALAESRELSQLKEAASAVVGAA